MRRETEVQAGVRRERRRLWRAAAIVVATQLLALILGVAALVLLVVGTLLGPLSLIDLSTYVVLVAVIMGFAGWAGGRWWVEVKGAGRLVKHIERADEAIQSLRRLREEHPELVELAEVQAVLNDEKAQTEGRRSFWVNIAVNLFFLLLGFALTYTATKLGWLR